ncbi:MAG: crosslink repair DNA glycosylase YcaQ family protein [Gemmatimonadota bacterium]
MPSPSEAPDGSAPALSFAAPATRAWFERSFAAPTRAQSLGWPAIASGASTLLLAPTGSGKTLAAFLVAIDRMMFGPAATDPDSTRVLYISPLKALGVDVERNLRAPLAGIRAEAERLGLPFHLPRVGVRTGDTTPRERRELIRQAPEILITTPESLYLMLTSNARETLRGVETVIIDEIHAIAATKRGTHLFLSLERLERQRQQGAPLQRVGLSATQRPLEEIARLLGGFETAPGREDAHPRPVEIVDASAPKTFDVRIEVPVEDMAALGEPLADVTSGPAAAGPQRASIWPQIHPRLLELIRQHRSTLIFVNSRRLAERLSTALNELAEEEIVMAHHGSVAPHQRADIEDRLKRGALPALVATSSLELGIDMGAIDLVIQIEAPPSVASGIQRFGRAGHHVGAVSTGVIFPKFRVDLLACAAVGRAVRDGWVESTAYPRNPLDVLAQQIVATVTEEPLHVDELFALVRRAAPYVDLPREAFERVLDMLSGHYPSDDFRELRPRITWDRITGELEARRGARMVSVISGGTIPDRGLYGVFLAGAERPVRIGELDEEMVFESREGEVFLLGASSWRIESIDHDRVLVSPAPGEPGKMPFWRGDGPGRPIEFGRAIGDLIQEVRALDPEAARARLASAHGLDTNAATNLVALLADQFEAGGQVPAADRIVIEQFVDEVGDWTVAILSPFGTRVHAPWAMAAAARLRRQYDVEVDTLWTDDGIVFKLPNIEEPPPSELFLPESDEVRDIVVDQLGSTALFASRFRENAARALLLPRQRPGRRTPLWVQRRRSADLLKAAAQFADFPIVLETYRDCLNDVFDLPGLIELLKGIEEGQVAVSTVQTRKASPFAASLLFGYVANFLYEGDVPLAERRAQALMLDHAQLLQLLGEPELRELLDPDSIAAASARASRTDGSRPLRDHDDVHDALISLGDLTLAEVEARALQPERMAVTLGELILSRRVFSAQIAGQERFIAAEDAARYRDALGVQPPAGLPTAFLQSGPDPLGDLLRRYARTHGPFTVQAAATRFGLGTAPVERALEELGARGHLAFGHFLPGGHGREWCDPGVLRDIKRRSLAHLRAQVEPVEPDAYARFLLDWHGVGAPSRGIDAVFEAVQQLQGAPLPASDLERGILPARVLGYDPRDLDELFTTGELVWQGVEPLGEHDGRIVLLLRDQIPLLATAPTALPGELEARIVEALRGRGALFFPELLSLTGGFKPEVLAALWRLVWSGTVTNDTLAPLRSLRRARSATRRTRGLRRSLALPPGSAGRWSLFPWPADVPSETERATALAEQLLQRHGLVTREVARAEALRGGFSSVYPILRRMEEVGKVRRGYFVEGLGGAQFGRAGVEDRLRRARDQEGDEGGTATVLWASDPANPYGAQLPWPERTGARASRSAGAQVILTAGRLAAWISPGARRVLTFLPADEPQRSRWIASVAEGLATLPETRARAAIVLESVDGVAPDTSPLAAALVEAGFRPSPKGWLRRRGRGSA